MRDFKNIDRLYQENLKDFEVFPPNKSWDAIEKRLVTIPNKRRYPFWIKISSVAALFILFFTAGTIYFMPENDLTKKLLPNGVDKEEIIDKKNNSDVVTPVGNSKAIEANTSISTLEVDNGEDLTILDGNTEETANDNLEETVLNKKVLNKYLLADAPKLPLQGEKKNKEVPEQETVGSKFTVATIFAPIYFSSFGDGSGVDAQFKDNPTSGNSSYSYGVKFAYQFNNKISLQSGVNLINLGYKTNNVYVTPGVGIVGFSNLSSSPLASRSQSSSKTTDETMDSNSYKGSLNQVFGYIEIPVEVKYSVADGKLGVNLVGGFSTLLLNRDEVFVETNSIYQSLGSSNNLRSINFSGNIGVDLDYSIRKNLYINVSPMFKIQTNTFSRNSGSLQPYYLGVYTGLNYKF